MNNKPALNNQPTAYPDDKVGHDPGTYDPYNAGPYDLEVPPYNEYDDVDDVSLTVNLYRSFSLLCAQK
jgi:hypothetical protein